MKILVTGGTGFVGRAVCADLARLGHDVVVVSRREEPAGPGLRRAPWSALGRELEGAGAVVHLAGENIASGRWTAARKRAIRESRIDGTRSLVAALGSAAKKPEVLVSASAVGYYGDRGEEAVREDSAAGKGFLSELCRDWEAAASGARSLGVRVVCLRFGVVLGRGGGALDKMLLPFKCALGGPLGSGKQYMPWLHLDDAVGLVRWALENRSVSGPVNAVAPEAARNEDFTAALGGAVRRPAVLRAPAFALRLALGEMSDMLLTGARVEPAAAVAAGYAFRWPALAPALADLVR